MFGETHLNAVMSARPAAARPPRVAVRTQTIALFSTLFFSDVSGWVQLLVTTWILKDGSHPALWIPVFFVARSAPKLLASPFAGSLADSVDRVRLYRASRLLAILPPLLLAVAAASPVPWTVAIIAITALGALCAAIDQPARRGLLWDFGGPRRVLGSVSLGTAAFHSAASLAPVLAVVLAGTLGARGALNATIAISVCSAVSAYWFARLHGSRVAAVPAQVDRRALCGIQYLLRTPSALLLLALTGAPGLIGRALAIVIGAIADGHARTGALASAPGAGAFAAAVALAMLGEVTDKSRFALLCAATFTVSVSLYPLVGSYYGEAALLALAGAASASFGSVIVSLLHLQVPDHLRCRVMAL